MQKFFDKLKKQCHPAQLMSAVAAFSILHIVYLKKDQPAQLVRELLVKVSPIIVLVFLADYLCKSKRKTLAYGLVLAYIIYVTMFYVKEETKVVPKQKDSSGSDSESDTESTDTIPEKLIQDIDDMAFDPSAQEQGLTV